MEINSNKMHRRKIKTSMHVSKIGNESENIYIHKFHNILFSSYQLHIFQA